MAIKLPNFFLAGAPKSGTTFIARALSRHPDVYVPETKEPAFFSKHPKHGMYEKGLKFYKKNFYRSEGFKYVCDASTIYFYDNDAPSLIKGFCPEAKIVIILRNPVDRVYSNYWQYIKSGYNLQPFHELLEGKAEIVDEMVEVSRYDAHLNRFLDTFPSKNILVQTYDDLKSDPERVLQQILSFLDLKWDPKIMVVESSEANLAGVPKSRSIARILRYKNGIQSLKALTPAPLVAPGRRLLNSLRQSNSHRKEYEPMDENMRKTVWVMLKNVPESVESITNLDLSCWKQDRDNSL